jgi:hypothetical protein
MVRKVLAVGAAVGLALASGRAAGAEPPAAPDRAAAPSQGTWWQRYVDARKELVAGNYDEADLAFQELSRSATSEADRDRALEMSKLAAALSERTKLALYGAPGRPRATKGEMWLLYASSFLYGVGTGAWYLLQAEPEEALTATLPFAGLTGAPVLAVALVDNYRPFRRGVPQGISAGLYMGLGQGLWVSAYQHARAKRVGGTPWDGAEIASALWGGATLGGVLGGAITTGIDTTPGRVSFVASTTLWAGILSRFGAGVVIPDGPRRSETALLVGGIGYNLGFAGGALLSGVAAPSINRVRIVDLSGLAGGLAAGGLYIAIARSPDQRVAFGLTGGGALAGLTAGWLLTSSMTEAGAPKSAKPSTWQPTVTPTPGGGMVGATGLF